MPAPRPIPTNRSVLSHLGVMIAVSAVMGVLVAGLALPVAGLLGVSANGVSKSLKNLPEALKAEPLAQRTRVLDRHGKVIATFYDENRVNVRLDQVAPIMRQAIVAIEDNRFYEHGAIDIKGTIRAFITNQANNGVTQGGSSITQQMAKMTLLNQAKTKAERKAATADTYQRKIQELRHAIAFEQTYSKDWILERYLNIAYFGDGAYGIQAAARHYFSRNASQLNLRQAALLAGLVKNPVGYDPSKFTDRAVARRNVVLDRMAQLNLIPAATADKLGKVGLGLKLTPTRNGCLGSKAAFFCEYVRRYLLADPALGQTVADRIQLLNSGGLTIKTTVDMRFQRAADKSTRNHVSATDNAIGALATVQPGTGDVLAISQSRPMGRNAKKGQTFLNYVVDSKYGDSNGFQAGSTFKIFVVAAALEQGLPTQTKFNSPARISIPQNEFQTCNGPYPVTSPWQLANSTGSGTFNMYTGTQHSVNTYFAQLEKKTGLCKPYALAKAMGIDLTEPDKERVPSFTLGIANVSPLEMASAYATLGARGEHCDNRPVTRILNSDGRPFKVYPKKCKQVIQQNTADTINDILRGVMEPGGFGSGLALNKPSAGKTGTINSNMAVWFCGYTPTAATASMIAGANRLGHWVTLNGQTIGGRYVASAFGSTTAGPMWADEMRAIQDILPNTNFVRPIATKPATPPVSVVPNVFGLTVKAAAKALLDAGFGVTISPSVESTVPASMIFQQSPSAGSTAYDGSTVTIVPSSGRPAPTLAPPSAPPNGPPTAGPGNGHGNGNGNGNGRNHRH